MASEKHRGDGRTVKVVREREAVVAFEVLVVQVMPHVIRSLNILGVQFKSTNQARRMQSETIKLYHAINGALDVMGGSRQA